MQYHSGGCVLRLAIELGAGQQVGPEFGIVTQLAHALVLVARLHPTRAQQNP